MAHPQPKQDNMTPHHNENNSGGFDDAPRRVPKALKWLAGTAIGVVVLAAGVGIIATQVIDQKKYKDMITSEIEDSTGYVVDWDGDIRLGLMPLPHASVNDLSVKTGNREVLSIAKAEVQVALAPLLSKKIHIKNISLSEPVVSLFTARNGKQTWISPKMEKKNDGVKTAAESVEDNTPPAFDITVDRVDITDGKFISDNQQTQSKQELANLNLSLRAESMSGPFDVSGDTVWSGQKIEIKATSGEVNGTEGTYPIQASVAMPAAGVKAEFSGTVDAKTTAANGDINVSADDIAKAAKAFTGKAPELPKGLDGKALVAGKLVYTSQRAALDDMALSFGALNYAGQLSADGLGGNDAPQLSFSLDPKTSTAAADAAPLVTFLSNLTIAAKGTLEGDKIQIISANVKTQGNDLSVNGYATTGENPTVDLTLNSDELNLDSLQQKLSSPAASSEPVAATSKGSAPAGFAMPFAGHVRANVAKLTTGGKTYTGVKADVTSQSNGALTISSASVNLPENASVDVKGKIADTKTLSGLDMTVVAKAADAEKLMASYGVDTASLPQKVGAASLDGHFTGDLKNLGFVTTISALQFNVGGAGTVVDPLGAPVISSLKFTIKHPNFNEAMKTFQPGFEGSSGFYGALDLSGQVAWGNDKYDVTNLTGKLGATTLAGNISAATKPKMAISGMLDIGNIVLPSATDNGGKVAATPSAAAGTSSGDRWSRDAIDTAWMRSFDADLKIKAKSITQNMWKLTDANFAFNLKDGVLTLDDVSAGLFGGRAAINGTVKSGAGAKDPLTIDAKMNANNVDAQGLMSAATGKVSHTLTGTLSDVNVAINATGASPAALVQTLGGKGTMNGKNIIVQGVDAAQLAETAKGSYKPLERAGSLFQTFQSGSTEFTDFNSEFAITNGIVNFSKIYFDGPKATLNSTGDVNLPAWTVNLKNTMTVKNTDIPPFDFTIKGPLDNPMNSGGDIINNYLQNKLEKKATKLIENKLGKLLGAPATDAAPAADAVPAADGTAAPTEAAPAPQPTAKQQAAQEAVKALQGIFAK